MLLRKAGELEQCWQAALALAVEGKVSIGNGHRKFLDFLIASDHSRNVEFLNLKQDHNILMRDYAAANRLSSRYPEAMRLPFRDSAEVRVIKESLHL